MNMINPLRTENRRVPPQLVLGTVTDNVEAASEGCKNVAEGMVFGNFILSAVMKTALGAMYTMINSLQMVMVISLMVVAMPANVTLVTTQVNIVS
jgi:hypothetical protein